MVALGPYERRPQIAGAVSGGADSMALTLLADRWARARGGRVRALTVDHGLRAAAAGEARQVGRWMRARGIAHATLHWRGPKPKVNIQAAARDARYDLLSSWCARHGVLHLLTAHHADDQAETFLLRLARGSGAEGLASSPVVLERPAMRVLRPLLGVPRARLVAELARAGQGWVEDPTNADTAHARVRMRALATPLAAEGLTASRLVATARHLARARAALERDTAAFLARALRLDPAGFARLDREALRAADPEWRLRALARVVRTLGGEAHRPRMDGLEALCQALLARDFRGRTLGGCIIDPAGMDAVLVCREAGTLAPPIALVAGVPWDGRFISTESRARLVLGALGPEGWRRVLDELEGAGMAGAAEALRRRFPPKARASLPAIFDRRGLLAAPHLGFVRRGTRALPPFVAFSPAEALLSAPFAVV
ncbi:MAG: tRNA lysidine(34) synthetase TilS [Alphaproteobacteria bacterium]